MKFFKRFCKKKPDLTEIRSKIVKLESICTRHYSGMRQSPNGCVVGIVGCTETLDETVKKLSKRLEMVIDYLELEVHTPDCEPVLRKKGKKK